MSFWNRQKPTVSAESTPVDVVAVVPEVVPELDALAKLIPERDKEGQFYWQPFVDRIVQRFDGLPAPDGGESFVRACLAAGCEAVPVIQRNVMWRNHQPPASDEKGRAAFELRIRLGLFLAASLRYLVHGVCRLRIKIGDLDWHPWKERLQAGEVRWHPILGTAVPFRKYLAACDREPEITWLETAPTGGQVCAVVPRFFQAYELRVMTLDMTLELFVELLECVQPGTPNGLFGHMLFSAGQIEEEREEEEVDVAATFLGAVRQAVKAKRLRVNTNPGDLFVTPELSFLVAPAAVDLMIKSLRKRGPRFVRTEIYQALGAAGCLVGIGPNVGQHTPWATVTSSVWKAPIRIRGLPITHGALWDAQAPPPFLDGTVKVEG